MSFDFFSDTLIKFCEKEEYADDIINGKIYINEAGKFHNTNNTFRSDTSEGKLISNKLRKITTSNDSTNIHINIHTNTTLEFQGGNKLPIFCASLLNEQNAIRVSENEFQFRPNYIEHMKQFGSFIVLFSKKEFTSKFDNYAQKHLLSGISSPVLYKKIKTEEDKFEKQAFWHYKTREDLDKKHRKDFHDAFFTKYISDKKQYHLQNEWRLIITHPQIIKEGESHTVLDIGKMNSAIKLTPDSLTKEIISINFLKK